MVGRRNRNEPYQIVGWSFRLFPHFTVAQGPPNRGSAFNSCLSMSSVPALDSIYLVSESGVLRFQRGEVLELGCQVPQVI